MNHELKALRINPGRLQANFEALAAIGATGDGGVHRPALSESHLAARSWFLDRARDAGLEIRIDSAGNHSACLSCGELQAPTLLLGSHLDSVLFGGRFDGALGVLAALEALQVVKENGLSLPVHLEAIDFTDEEGTLVGLLGSAAAAGELSQHDLENPRGGRAALLAGLQRSGLSEEGLLCARRDPQSLAGYLELHIEQGPRLLQAGADIGVVTGIVGIVSARLTYLGREDHAGVTPLSDRLDAGLGACAFTLAARRIVQAEFPDCVTNIGAMRFEPGAFNIVPARAVLSLEFRAPDPAVLDRLETAVLAAAGAAAEDFGLGLEVDLLGKHQPAPMSAAAQAAVARAAGDLGLAHLPITSGAGHDAQMLAGLCPAGMIFIPSAGGASHSPREFSEWQDCVNGANVLLQAALRMAFQSIYQVMRKLHLDTAIGGDIDDLCALALVLSWPGAELVAITTVAEHQGKRAGYARYVLGLAGRQDIPVAAGAGASLDCYRSWQGLPDENAYWPEPVPPFPTSIDRALSLLENSIEQGAAIVAIGPFTNLALLEERSPGILRRARLYLMGGYVFPPREGFPVMGSDMDWNVQVDARSALIVFQRSKPTLVPLSITVETSLRRAYLPILRQSGPVAQLLARQAEAFARDEKLEARYGQTCRGLPDDTINFLHDPLACAIALGWNEGVEIREFPLISEIRDGWLLQRMDGRGQPTSVVSRVDGEGFNKLWLDAVTRENIELGRLFTF